ncbi:P-loop containing nucleoside triphosphate hydrolase protein [Basidiobolus meristosporus CBS 931.73]|uniref:GTP-binding protein 8 n=1 Tax=Basidiobolus meristosporus CBS 931.73 TaxID=1314790 RepID=A0A1Y1YN52_9FUNG|nr:P-loop containing nucleoside triphosphate hydrolase protein [Basidiobolus meristosporus CBS 931.73]|eukprot:ORX99460.1 P-loop containing nucleoside triphosphate hydrolase protein [Basidiobolus meristosporus CBS 931.73]
MFQLYSNIAARGVCINARNLFSVRSPHAENVRNLGTCLIAQARKGGSLTKEKPRFPNRREASSKKTLPRSAPRTLNSTQAPNRKPVQSAKSKGQTTARSRKPPSKTPAQRPTTVGYKLTSGTKGAQAKSDVKTNRVVATSSAPRNSYGISFAKLAKELPPVPIERSLVETFNPIKEVSSTEEKLLESLFRKPAIFIQSAVKINQLQNTELPEVAFIGRSNVGKSSLINALVNRNSLVKTSSKPGHTKLLNFFRVSDQLVLTDMPGYGHGCRDDWRRMIWNYFKDRSLLRRVFLLVNCEHSLKGSDKELIGVLEKLAVPYQIILTKQDKAKQVEIGNTKRQVQSYLIKKIKTRSCVPVLLSVSARKKKGINELRRCVLEAAEIQL